MKCPAFSVVLEEPSLYVRAHPELQRLRCTQNRPSGGLQPRGLSSPSLPPSTLYSLPAILPAPYDISQFVVGSLQRTTDELRVFESCCRHISAFLLVSCVYGEYVPTYHTYQFAQESAYILLPERPRISFTPALFKNI